MAKSKNKYYVVWLGYKPGIYSSWKECQSQVVGYAGAKYKGFPNYEAAQKAFHSNFKDHIGTKKEAKSKISGRVKFDKNSIAVDAACSGNPGNMEYRGVVTATSEEIFRMGPYRFGTNNVGEFLAIVHALAILKNQNKNDVIIYTDSKTAMAWVRNKKVKTTLEKNRHNEILFDLMDRAILWLKNNEWNNEIVKWPTKEWGEIPADFGRK